MTRKVAEFSCFYSFASLEFDWKMAFVEVHLDLSSYCLYFFANIVYISGELAEN